MQASVLVGTLPWGHCVTDAAQQDEARPLDCIPACLAEQVTRRRLIRGDHLRLPACPESSQTARSSRLCWRSDLCLFSTDLNPQLGLITCQHEY